MRRRKLFMLTLAMPSLFAIALLAPLATVSAQTAPSAAAGSGAISALDLWTDPSTGQVFTRPGPGRVPLKLPVATPQSEQALAVQLQQQKQQTAELEQKVEEITPAWQDYMSGFKNKVALGAQFWGDYSLYTHTSWGPQLLTQINPPGPGNNMYNSFDITRAYLNFFFNPTPDWTLRITPNIYRSYGATANQSFGRTSALGSDLNGNLSYRLKYGYVQWNTPFQNLGIEAIKDDKIVLGQQAQPLTAWEEDLYGYRFVNLTTWNMSLSSTFPGITIQGPIKWGPENLQYIDYNFGAFNNASFHTLEQTNTKEVMGRVSLYPMGAKWRFDGLGLTTFYDYGYGNVTPDAAQLPTPYKGSNAMIERLAEIVHYTTDTWGVAFEYDWGRNAWSPGNQFSGSGPSTLFGIAPTDMPASYVINQQAYSNLASALLNNGRSYQQGFNLFGHYHIPDSKFTVFGWLEQWNPNTDVKANPFDYQRFVLGVSYQYNEYLRFAVDEQAILYYHNQQNFPVSYAKTFNWQTPKGFTGSTINNVVIPDMHVTMFNVEYAF
jgi:hypothetical protein